MIAAVSEWDLDTAIDWDRHLRRAKPIQKEPGVNFLIKKGICVMAKPCTLGHAPRQELWSNEE